MNGLIVIAAFIINHLRRKLGTMKKAIMLALAAVALNTAAHASYVINQSSQDFSDGHKVWYWTGNGDKKSISGGRNWSYLTSSTSNATVVTAAGTNPQAGDTLFIGYSFDSAAHTLTANGDTIAVDSASSNHSGVWTPITTNVYLGTNVTYKTSASMGFLADTTYSFNFADFSGTSVISTSSNSFSMQSGSKVNFGGALTMTSNEFEYVLFSSDNMLVSLGSWDASAVTVTAADGTTMTYDADGAETHALNTYWLETTNEEVNGKNHYTVKLKAYGAPEPATATLSLLALAGLAARRRRH